ncbi:hypothetical protein D3C87_1617510 [compost metagenome]
MAAKSAAAAAWICASDAPEEGGVQGVEGAATGVDPVAAGLLIQSPTEVILVPRVPIVPPIADATLLPRPAAPEMRPSMNDSPRPIASARGKPEETPPAPPT